jgi:Ger(x)C family germination protein
MKVIPTVAHCKNDAKISHWQLMSLLAVSFLYSQLAALPDCYARGGFLIGADMERFITLTVSTVVILLLYLPLIFLLRRYDRILPGGVLGWIIGIVLIARLLYSAGFAAVQLESFVLHTILPYFSPLLFVLTTFAVVLYGSQKGFQATARIAPLALLFLLVAIISVALFLIPQMEVIRLYSPFASLQVDNAARSVLSDVARNDELFFFIVLCGFVRRKEVDGNTKSMAHKSVLYYLPLVLIFSLLLNFLYNVVLGRALRYGSGGGHMPYPLYTISTFASFNVVERMDGVAVSAVVLGGLLKITLSFICIRIVLAHLINANMMKRCLASKITTSVFVAAVAVVVFTAVGCSSKNNAFLRTEQRILVQLVGIDINESNEFTISVQFPIGDSSIDGDSGNFPKTITGTGQNLYSAIKEAQADAGKDLFFGHNQVLILGEKILSQNRHDVVSVIESALTHASQHSTALVAGVYGKAEDVLSLTYKDEDLAQNRVYVIMKNAKNTGIFPVYSIHETLMQAYDSSGSFFVPMLKIEDLGRSGETSEGVHNNYADSLDDVDTLQDESTADPKIIPHGGALIINGEGSAGMVTFLDAETCMGLVLLANTSQTPSIDFVYDGENRTIEKFKAVTRISPVMSDGLSFCVKFSAVTDRSYSHKQNIEELKEPAIEAIRERLYNAFSKSVALGGDLFGLEDTLKFHNYSAWKNAAESPENWRELLRNAEFTISAEISII